MARPQHLWHYGNATVTQLAALYAVGIAKNHAFLDGNKRTAFVASILFLEENGYRFQADPATAEHVFVSVAAGEMDEVRLADWFAIACGESSGILPGGHPLIERE